MRLNRYFYITLVPVVIVAFISGCGSSSHTPSTTNTNNYPYSHLTNGNTLTVISGDNVMPLSVNGSLCSSDSYLNKPCVSVKVCDTSGLTSGTHCQVIDDILLDTGSSGFRVFKSVLTSSLQAALTPINISGNKETECLQFGDGSATWGPVELADIILGNESAVQLPIQVIDSTFGNSSSCSGAVTGPTDPMFGANGLLGVGLFVNDCGADCVTYSNTTIYYKCTSTTSGTCSGTTVSLSNQVNNPVSYLATDNNGVILELPSISDGGVTSLTGYLVLGIGTRSNNVPSSTLTVYPTDTSYGEFSTTFNGKTYSGIIDSGSNALYFDSSSATNLPACSSPNSDFFCPLSTVSLTAVTTGYTGTPNENVTFDIGNMTSLTSSSNNSGNDNVFIEIGGLDTSVFDWGLPFHIGRNVYVGIENKSSSLGSGPYWAY